MARRSKLAKYAENLRCSYLIEPSKSLYTQLRSQWCSQCFKENKPITAELGCGRGEYTLGLAARFPDRNFVGIDYKGARLWAGSQQAEATGLGNVVFLQARIEELSLFFAPGELARIYLTFPDPYPKPRHVSRRLSSPHFLRSYAELLHQEGEVVLKTDARSMFLYTKAQLETLNVQPELEFEDIHAAIEYTNQEEYGLLSTYEKKALSAGLPIYYLRFSFPSSSHSSSSSSKTSARKP